MRVLRRLILWLVIALVAATAALAAPVIWIETRCLPDVTAAPAALTEDNRTLSRTLTTYPEWHIVHAYDDYAAVTAHAPPHAFGFARAVRDYWSSLCTLTGATADMGGLDPTTKTTLYVIGVSFTAELAAKAAYEETLGRLFAGLQGTDLSAADRLLARQAADYATFLQQVPWYAWGFDTARAELAALPAATLRDRERQVAVGLEYRAKALYARAIAAAVAATGDDVVRLTLEVTGLPPETLATLPDVQVMGPGAAPGTTRINTPRYRVLTHLLQDMATRGANFSTIAGNDRIMFTALSPTAPGGALYAAPRQGRDDWRGLYLVPVADLAQRLRDLPGEGITLEHIHDY